VNAICSIEPGAEWIL